MSKINLTNKMEISFRFHAIDRPIAIKVLHAFDDNLKGCPELNTNVIFNAVIHTAAKDKIHKTVFEFKPECDVDVIEPYFDKAMKDVFGIFTGEDKLVPQTVINIGFKIYPNDWGHPFILSHHLFSALNKIEDAQVHFYFDSDSEKDPPKSAHVILSIKGKTLDHMEEAIPSLEDAYTVVKKLLRGELKLPDIPR